MIFLKSVISIILLSVSFSVAQLDTSLLNDNTWFNIQPGGTSLTINGSNWAYENDLKSHPFAGIFLMGPGHVVHPQDCYWYPFDPIKNKWMKIGSPIPPTRQCLSSFSVSSQDSVIIQWGGAEASHQLSQGAFSSAYQSIIQGSRGSKIWVYSFNRNEWYHMKNGELPPNSYTRIPQYDPIHDISISSKGSATWVYNFHQNTSVSFSTPASFNEYTYSTAMDTKRGLFYVLHASGLWCFNPDSSNWIRRTAAGPSYPSYEMALSPLAYDEINDVLIYTHDETAGSPAVETWAFLCDSLVWRKQTPAIAPLDRGRLAYNRPLNCFMMLGGQSDNLGGRGGGFTGIWMYRYKRASSSYYTLPSAPNNGYVSTNEGSVKLTWSRVSDPSVTGYDVYRANVSTYAKNFIKVNNTPVTDTFYTDASATLTTSYAYRIRAIKGGYSGHPSRLFYTKPGRVLNPVASVEESTIVKVSWDKNPEQDIAGYNIYRARGAAIYAGFPASYVKINASPVNAQYFIDTIPSISDGVARGYVVTAINTAGLESGVTQECTTFPNPPEWAYTIPVAGKMRFGWQPPRRTKILGINFYRILGSIQNINGLITDTMTTGWDLPPTTETDGYSLMGKTYVARAVNILGQEGFMTDQISPSNTEYGYGLVPTAMRYNDKTYTGVSIEDNSQYFSQTLSNSNISISPNPFNPTLKAEWRMEMAGKATLQVLDVNGRLLISRKITGKIGQNKTDIEMSKYASGVYYIRVLIGNRVIRKTAVLAR